MHIEELKKLTQDLEKILSALKMQTDPEVRRQIFFEFKDLYFKLKKELVA